VEQSVEDLQVVFDFFKEDGATEEELTSQYEKTLVLVEDLESKNICRM